MTDPKIWTELVSYGIGVALSPIHLVLLLLLLLGDAPRRRGGLFVVGWWLTSALVGSDCSPWGTAFYWT